MRIYRIEALKKDWAKSLYLKSVLLHTEEADRIATAELVEMLHPCESCAGYGWHQTNEDNDDAADHSEGGNTYGCGACAGDGFRKVAAVIIEDKDYR